MSQHSNGVAGSLDRLFSRNQEKLPIEDRAAVKVMCCILSPSVCGGYKCTKERGHLGGHIAHGRLGEVIVKWIPSMS